MRQKTSNSYVLVPHFISFNKMRHKTRSSFGLVSHFVSFNKVRQKTRNRCVDSVLVSFLFASQTRALYLSLVKVYKERQSFFFFFFFF